MAEPGRSRQRMVRIKKAIAEGEPLKPDDIAFAETYTGQSIEELRQEVMPTNGAHTDSSVAAERITHTHTEERVGMSTGNQRNPLADLAAGASDVLDSAGIRATTLLRIASEAMISANEQHARLAELCLQRLSITENAMVEMMEAVRDHYHARTEAEANQIKAAHLAELSENGDDFGQFMEFIKVAIEAHNAKGKKKPKHANGTSKANGKPLGQI